MKLFDSLTQGQTVTFKKKPLGSYITEGEPYLVEWKSAKSVYFRNPRTGGGTYDRDYAVNFAEVA